MSDESGDMARNVSRLDMGEALKANFQPAKLSLFLSGLSRQPGSLMPQGLCMHSSLYSNSH